MKKIICVFFLLSMIPMMMNAQTYSNLWKQAKDAEGKRDQDNRKGGQDQGGRIMEDLCDIQQ